MSRHNSGEGTGNDASYNPALSADGAYVVFQSEASDLICERRCGEDPPDVNLLTDVFMLNRLTNKMVRISSDGTAPWMEASAGPAIDAAARVIAFSSRHPVDSDDESNDYDLFVFAILR